jgi:hypothetical protein
VRTPFQDTLWKEGAEDCKINSYLEATPEGQSCSYTTMTGWCLKEHRNLMGKTVNIGTMEFGRTR